MKKTARKPTGVLVAKEIVQGLLTGKASWGRLTAVLAESSISEEPPANLKMTTNQLSLFSFLLIVSLGLLMQGNWSRRDVMLGPGPTPSREDCASAPIGPIVPIRGGTMAMGIDVDKIPEFEKIFGVQHPQLFEDEVPKHAVTLHDFEIDRCEVTNAQFKRFTEANPEWQPDHLQVGLDNGGYLKHWDDGALRTRADHPVVNVNWYAAVAYCQWAGKRLPTEAEWEYAARGGRAALFPWGDEPPDPVRANFQGSGLKGTSAVGSYPPNAYRLFDMAGNVWEFLVDEWRSYPSGTQTDPVAGGNLFAHGTEFLKVRSRRVIRGGSFGGSPVNLWVEYRDSHPPDGSREFVGFRCAK